MTQINSYGNVKVILNPNENENWESELEDLTSEIFDLCKSYSFATCNY